MKQPGNLVNIVTHDNRPVAANGTNYYPNADSFEDFLKGIGECDDVEEARHIRYRCITMSNFTLHAEAIMSAFNSASLLNPLSVSVLIRRYNILTEMIQATTMDNLRKAKGGTDGKIVDNDAHNQSTKTQSGLLR